MINKMRQTKLYIFLISLFLSLANFAVAQNSYTINGLAELQVFVAGGNNETVKNLIVIEPSGGTVISEAEIMKITQRVSKITGVLTFQGLTALTTTVGLIDVIDCSEAGFVFKNCAALENMNAFSAAGKFSTINGDFIIEDCPKTGTGAATAYLDKSFSGIKEVKGDLILKNITTAMNKPEKLLPNLEKVEGDFVVDGCTRLYYFSNSTNTANMPLRYVGGDIVIRNNPSFQKLNGLGTLEHIGGNVTILDNGAIPTGSTDDESVGFCKIKYYLFAGILSETATVKVGRTGSLVDLNSLVPCPYEIVEDVDGTFTAIPANKFLASIGVNSAINSRGESVEKTKEIMEYLGARWIRTNMGGGVAGGNPLPETTLSGAGNSISAYKKLYDEAGIKFSAGLGAGGIETNIPILIDNAKRLIAATSPDILIAIEGNNEPNNRNWYVIFEGEVGGGKGEGQYNWKPVARMQKKLYADVKADPVLGTSGQNYPVWNLTYGGASEENVGVQYLKVPEDDMEVPVEFRGVTFADAANLHNYFNHPSFSAPQNNQTWRAAEPGINIPSGIDVLYRHYGVTWLKKYKGYLTDEELKALPKVTTETGTTISGNVTEEMQALMYMSLYLSQFARGFDYTAMYLLTDRRDEAGNQSFGFYDRYYNPRQAAHYMHNLTTILKDDTSIETPGELTYSITGRTINIHDLLLQKKNGTFELVIWGEKYRGGSDKITIGLDKKYDEVWVYNPTKGTNPEIILRDVSLFDLDVSNHPYIIEIGEHPLIGIEHEENDLTAEIRVFPNPVVNDLSVRSNIEIKDVILYNTLGKCIYQCSGSFNDLSIEMSHLPQGTYVLNLFDKNYNCIKTQKIIK